MDLSSRRSLSLCLKSAPYRHLQGDLENKINELFVSATLLHNATFRDLSKEFLIE